MAQSLLDNQLTNNRTMIRGVIILILTIAMAVFISAFAIYQTSHSDPYVRDVLALEGNLEQGRFIFQMNCSSCHGIYGDGQVGPSLRHVSERKSRVGLIHQVTSGKTPPMPQFQPNSQEMADLLKFLESL